jgi:hypothetical protein
VNRKHLLIAAGLLIVVLAVVVALALPSRQPRPCTDVLNCKSGGGPTGAVVDRRIPARLAIVAGGVVLGGALAFGALRESSGERSEDERPD